MRSRIHRCWRSRRALSALLSLACAAPIVTCGAAHEAIVARPDPGVSMVRDPEDDAADPAAPEA